MSASCTAGRRDAAAVERAFQLASSGDCRSIADLECRLTSEQYEDVAEHLAGRLIRHQLRERMRNAPQSVREHPATAARTAGLFDPISEALTRRTEAS